MLRYVVFIFVISLVMGGNIDHTAHAGGLAGGFLIGMIMPAGPYRTRRQEALWRTLAALGVFLVLYSFFRVARMATGA